jgi:hypothetical protein
MSSAVPTPKIGKPLPRAADAYAEPEKWRDWILAERGHGSEWAHVFHVDPGAAEKVWSVIVEAVIDAPLHKIADRGPNGVVCGVDMKLTIGSRSARVRTSWHYESAGAAPRLVTAYPRL